MSAAESGSNEALLPRDEASQDAIPGKKPDDQRSGSETPNFLQRTWAFTRRYIVLVSLGLLLLAGAIVLIVYFVYLNNDNDNSDATPPSPSPAAKTCLTPACVLASAQLLDNLSPRYNEIDPCTNFDKYVCEGFNERHDLRPDQGRIFTGTVMAERGQQILRHLLEGGEGASTSAEGRKRGRGGADEAILEKLKDAYGACVDEGRVSGVGAKPLIEILEEVNRRVLSGRDGGDTGDMIVGMEGQKVMGAEREGLDWLTKTMIYLQQIGVTGLLDLGVGADDRDPDSVVPFVSAPRSPGLPSKEYYDDAAIVVNYGKVVGQVLEGLLEEAGRKISDANPVIAFNEKLVQSLVVFEGKLANATPSTADAEDVTFSYNPMTLDEIKSDLLPQLDLESLVHTLAPTAPRPGKLIVGSPHYLKTVSSLLQNVELETIRVYFVWKAVQAYAYKVESPALRPLKRFNNRLQGKEPDAVPERWRTCVSVADRSLGWILSRFFVEKAFSEEARAFGNEIVSDIKMQFVQKLKRAEWMSKAVRELGIQKVHAIVQKIGYPVSSPDIRNASALEEYYSAVNISADAYFGNTLSVAAFDTQKEWSALGKPTDRDQWEMTASTVNAYYNPPGNEIVFPAGIMQTPVFFPPPTVSNGVPTYLTYGAFGAVAGHELSHAFDSTGRHYDQRGNYTDWWDDDTVQGFEDRAQCFVEQYSEFQVPYGKEEGGLHVNGRLTLGENIADAGGLNAAFEAWKGRVGGKEGGGVAKRDSMGVEVVDDGSEELLPGWEHFTREQLFFISYAGWWCGKARPETEVEGVYRDPHAPTWARILGTMNNSRYFKEAFRCEVKDPVCELW